PPPVHAAASTMIELRDVTKQFTGKRNVVALDAITLAIPRGEMVAIIGPSGSGKSTLLNLIGGLDRPSAGQVSVDGAPLAALADEPPGNLDTRTGEEILTLIRDVHSRLGSTVVIVTHDMSVAGSCERTIALRDGKVVADIRR